MRLELELKVKEQASVLKEEEENSWVSANYIYIFYKYNTLYICVQVRWWMNDGDGGG